MYKHTYDMHIYTHRYLFMLVSDISLKIFIIIILLINMLYL